MRLLSEKSAQIATIPGQTDTEKKILTNNTYDSFSRLKLFVFPLTILFHILHTYFEAFVVYITFYICIFETQM